jgi:hypothetical protein
LDVSTDDINDRGGRANALNVVIRDRHGPNLVLVLHLL